MKKYLNKKSIIIALIIIFVLTIIGITILYLYNNTTMFKSQEEVNEDISSIVKYVDKEKDKLEGEDFQDTIEIKDKHYSDYVGVSNGTLYIKENADSKVKKALEGKNVGQEKTIKSTNGIIEVEPYVGTNSVSCKVIGSNKEEVHIISLNAKNLCDSYYEYGTVKDKKQVEENKDELSFTRIMPNKTYTIANEFGSGTNTMFFFDENQKFISSTTQNTFTTPSNTKFVKIMSEIEEFKNLKGMSVHYCLVLGTKAGDTWNCEKTEAVVNMKEKNETKFPLTSEKLVIYVDDGELELSYVSK